MTAAVQSPMNACHLGKFEPLEPVKDALPIPSKAKTLDDSPPNSPVDHHGKPSLFDLAPTAWNCATAKEAVTSMGIPEHVVQMAIDVQRLDHGREFTDVGELFFAAETLICEPEIQAKTVMKLYNASEEAKAKKVQAEKAKAEKAKAEKTKAEKAKAEEAEMAKTIQESQSAEMLTKEPVDAKSMVGSKAQLEEKVKHLAKENHKLKQRKMCRACRKVDLASSGVTFLPCGHFITCETCSEMFDDCPACGKSIMGTVRTFLS